MIAHMLGDRSRVAHGTLVFVSIFGALTFPASSMPRMCSSSALFTSPCSPGKLRQARYHNADQANARIVGAMAAHPNSRRTANRDRSRAAGASSSPNHRRPVRPGISLP